VLFRRAIEDEEIRPINPTVRLRYPAKGKQPRRIASPERAGQLLDALPSDQWALSATAFYGGLRMGELRVLRWRHVDFDARRDLGRGGRGRR
jgi:integrase